MSLIGGLAIFGIIWWVVLFAVLPFGIRTNEEAGEAGVPGAAESAPVRPQLFRKIIVTTGIAILVWLLVFVLLEYRPIALDDVPFFPKFGDQSGPN